MQKAIDASNKLSEVSRMLMDLVDEIGIDHPADEALDHVIGLIHASQDYLRNLPEQA